MRRSLIFGIVREATPLYAGAEDAGASTAASELRGMYKG